MPAIRSQPDTSLLRRRQCRLGPLRYELAFMLGEGGQDMDHETIGVGCIDSDELDAALHQGGHKGDIPGKAIQFGNDQDRTFASTLSESIGKHGTFAARSALHFDMLADVMTTNLLKISRDGIPLRLDP